MTLLVQKTRCGRVTLNEVLNNYDLIKLHLIETPAQLFSCEFCAIFQKPLFTEHLQMTAPADSSVRTNALSIDHTFFGFPFIFFFLLLIIAIMGVC